MDAAIDIRRRAGRGPAMLLHHCLALDRLDDERESPAARLERTLGSGLAQLLVAALASPAQLRRGCSSP